MLKLAYALGQQIAVEEELQKLAINLEQARAGYKRFAPDIVRATLQSPRGPGLWGFDVASLARKAKVTPEGGMGRGYFSAEMSPTGGMVSSTDPGAKGAKAKMFLQGNLGRPWFDMKRAIPRMLKERQESMWDHTVKSVIREGHPEKVNPILEAEVKNRVAQEFELAERLKRPQEGIELWNRMTPQEKEMANRLAGFHEKAEGRWGKRRFDEGWFRESGHANPQVILEESNAIASLPPGYENVAEFFKYMRRSPGQTGPLQTIKNIYPHFQYGVTKTPKRAKKFLEDRIMGLNPPEMQR